MRPDPFSENEILLELKTTGQLSSVEEKLRVFEAFVA
jgi:hypothetical protein